MGEPMHQNPWKIGLARFVFTVGLLGSSSSALALGLGRMTLHSALDEPLRADIELTAVHPNDIRTLATGLAARSDFDNAGVDLAPHLRDIKYQVEQRPDGRYFLRLSTLQPVREPFLHFLLQVEWAGGRMIREYTALLDPPQLIAAARAADAERAAVTAPALDIPVETAPAAVLAATPVPEAVSDAPASMPETAAPQAAESAAAAPQGVVEAEADLLGPSIVADGSQAPVATVPTNATGENEPAVAATTAPATEAPAIVPAAAPTQYGPVRKGDNLTKIVRGVGQGEFSLEQMAVALFRANKGAFYGNNLNNLKVGKILSIPSSDSVAAVSRQQALKELRGHNDAWREYKQKLAAAAQAHVVPADDKVATTVAPSAKPSVAPATADNKAAAKEDLLRIVRGSADANAAKAAAGGSGAEQRALRDKVATLEESITSKELENKELRDRVAQLEQQIKNAQRLIQLENQTLAKAQKEAATAAPVAAPSAKAPTGTAKVDATKSTDVSTAKATVAAAPAVAAAHSPAPAQPAMNKPAGNQPAANKPAPAPAVTPVEEPSFFAGLLENPLLMPAGGGILVLACIGVLMHFRRRRKAIAEFGESILSGGINMNSEGNTANSGNAGEVSFLSDFSQGGMGNIHTDEVDPIAEAEVYLAYGRDEQAEEILKEAVVKDPSRHELRLKLLEIYHQRNDLGAFETVAEELYAALEGKGGKIWERVEELGHKMNPQNPLFRGGSARAAADAAVVATGAAGGAMAAEVAGTVLPNDTAFDLNDSGESAVATTRAPAAKAASAEEEFSFDIDFAPAAKAVDTGNAAAALNETVMMSAADSASAFNKPTTSEEPGIDFDFSSLTGGASSQTAQGAASDDLGISFDSDLALESPGAAGGAEISFEEVGADGVAEDTGILDVVDGGQVDEAATKLDLAKAYLDMGDAEGAKSILDEVLVEGSEVQRKQAAELAAQIAA